MIDQNKEYFRFEQFWNQISQLILRFADSSTDDESIIKDAYFMSGILTAQAEVLKVFTQEMGAVSPELQEKIDRHLKIFLRRQTGDYLVKQRMNE